MNIFEGAPLPDNDNIISRSLVIPHSLIEEARLESQQVAPLGLSVQRGGELVQPSAKPSWRTLLQSPLGAFLTGVKPRATFIQLAGHKGDFASASGVIFKKSSKLEKLAYEEITRDKALKSFVPMYFSTVMLRNEENEPVEFLQLQDLLCLFEDPSIMDVKMGIRTFQEQEITKTKRRKDLLEKMMKLDPNEPTAEEKEHGITKARYMIFRERLSSTNTLGLRVEAIKRYDEDPQMDFHRVNSVIEVTDALSRFLPDTEPLRSRVRASIIARLNALRQALFQSQFFKFHELIGSSLLFIYDSSGKTGVYMIDFGKTAKNEKELAHDVRWRTGTHEDGYLIGLDNLIWLYNEMDALDEDVMSEGADGDETSSAAYVSDSEHSRSGQRSPRHVRISPQSTSPITTHNSPPHTHPPTNNSRVRAEDRGTKSSRIAPSQLSTSSNATLAASSPAPRNLVEPLS